MYLKVAMLNDMSLSYIKHKSVAPTNIYTDLIFILYIYLFSFLNIIIYFTKFTTYCERKKCSLLYENISISITKVRKHVNMNCLLFGNNYYTFSRMSKVVQ